MVNTQRPTSVRIDFLFFYVERDVQKGWEVTRSGILPY